MSFYFSKPPLLRGYIVPIVIHTTIRKFGAVSVLFEDLRSLVLSPNSPAHIIAIERIMQAERVVSLRHTLVRGS